MKDQNKKTAQRAANSPPDKKTDESVDLARRMLLRSGVLAVPAVVAAFAITKPAYALPSGPDCGPPWGCGPNCPPVTP